MKRAVAKISSRALLHNLNAVRSRVGASRICAVVKANAYGHGARAVSSILEGAGVDFFAVATVDEGIELRLSGIKSDILILGYSPIDAVAEIAEYNLTQALISAEYSDSLAAECKRLGVSLKVHIKVDTGMHRLGFDAEDLESIFAISAHPCYKIDGIFSHFSTADEPFDSNYTYLQGQRLLSARNYLLRRGVRIPICHIANSAAVLLGGFEFDMVRPGLMLYGYGAPGLVPVMSLTSHIVSLRRIRRGERVGYSSAFHVSRDTLVATVPVGYADGVRRDASRFGVSFTVGGFDARVIGRVCMDYLMLDVTDLPGVSLFDDVILFGNLAGHTADDLARRFSTLPYEILTSVSPRVERIII